MTNSFPASIAADAAPDGRSFILGTAENAPRNEYRFFWLPIWAAGKPGLLTELPAYPVPVNAYITGIALSPDGIRLAVASSYGIGATHGGPATYMVGRGGGHQPGQQLGDLRAAPLDKGAARSRRPGPGPLRPGSEAEPRCCGAGAPGSAWEGRARAFLAS